MKFLLDVCAASRSMHEMLTELGHDVLSAAPIDPRAADEALLALAYEEQRVLITEDKDFGELVFVHRLPHPSIIRLVEMQVAEKVTAMRELIECHPDALLEGSLIVVTRSRVRIRYREHEERGNVQRNLGPNS